MNVSRAPRKANRKRWFIVVIPSFPACRTGKLCMPKSPFSDSRSEAGATGQADLLAALDVLTGRAAESSVALEGIIELSWQRSNLGVLASLGFPETLQSLNFGDQFNQALVSLPSTLQSLTFGYSFNRRLGVTLPSTLKALTFGHRYNHSLLPLPGSLQLGGKQHLCSLGGWVCSFKKGFEFLRAPFGQTR